jgi:hypothetical protein
MASLRAIGFLLHTRTHRMVLEYRLLSLVKADINELSMAGFLCLHFCTLFAYYT